MDVEVEAEGDGSSARGGSDSGAPEDGETDDDDADRGDRGVVVEVDGGSEAEEEGSIVMALMDERCTEPGVAWDEAMDSVAVSRW